MTLALCVVAVLGDRSYPSIVSAGTDSSENHVRRALTKRELEVIDLASLGLTNATLAERLGVTVSAVKFHLASIYRKLSVANRTEAVAIYLRSGQVATRPLETGEADRWI